MSVLDDTRFKRLPASKAAQTSGEARAGTPIAWDDYRQEAEKNVLI